MDKIIKGVKKLSKKEADKIAEAIKLILNNKVKNLDIKKLKGHPDIFRVRVGHQRIIFRRKNQRIFILSISHRDEKTYKKIK